MRPYLLAPLLFLLSEAAPAAQDRAESTALQKRDAACMASYGRGIVKQDCDEAMVRMRRMAHRPIIHPETGRLFPNIGGFSRNNPDGQYRLPQMFTVRTCTIFVDIANDGASVAANWDILAVTANMIVERCVPIIGIGGQNIALGFNVLVLNQANMDSSLHQAWQHCLELVRAQDNANTMAQCVLTAMEKGQAASRATQQRQARAMKDTSTLDGID